MVGKDDKKLIWNKFATLEKLIKSKTDDLEIAIGKKASDSEKEAKQASRKTTEYRNRAKKNSDESERYLKIMKEYSDKSDKNYALISEILKNLNKLDDEAIEIRHRLEESHNYISSTKTEIRESTNEIRKIISENDGLENEIQKISISVASADEMVSKINTLLQRSNTKKQEIDNSYNDIYGYDLEDEDGNVDHVDGLKKELDTSYIAIKKDIEGLTSDLQDSKLEITDEYSNNLDSLRNDSDNALNNFKEQFENTHKEIKDLLPDAMTAGLSHAYAEKKKEEIISYNELKSSFKKAIFGLIIVSFLPVAIDVWLLNSGTSLEDVLAGTPKMVFSILPLMWQQLSGQFFKRHSEFAQTPPVTYNY